MVGLQFQTLVPAGEMCTQLLQMWTLEMLALPLSTCFTVIERINLPLPQLAAKCGNISTNSVGLLSGQK